jgi:hypothetical protein
MGPRGADSSEDAFDDARAKRWAGSSKCRHKFALRERPQVTLGWELSGANGAQKIAQLLRKSESYDC